MRWREREREREESERERERERERGRERERVERGQGRERRRIRQYVKLPKLTYYCKWAYFLATFVHTCVVSCLVEIVDL